MERHQKLEGLQRVDGKGLATRCIAGPHLPRYAVEPGDATHYEVATGGLLAVCVVGSVDDDNLNGCMVHAASGHWNVIGKPSAYTLEVCRYFAACAADPDGFWARSEPDGLASRRR